MALATLSTAAGAGLIAMYLEGKLALIKDLKTLNQLRRVKRQYLEAVKRNQLSPYYKFEESVRQRLNDECIWSREGCFSWSQTYKYVNQFGNWFQSKGVQVNDFVAVCMTNSPEFMFVWLGLWSIGAAPAMINCNLKGKRLLHCLKVSRAEILIFDDSDDIKARIEDVRDEIVNEIGLGILLSVEELKHETSQSEGTRPDDIYRSGVKGDSPIAMFFTSGTTGLPKGVPFTVERCLYSALSFKSRILSTDDRWYNCMPLYHATGGVIAFSSLMNSLTLAIGKKFSVSKFWYEVRDSRATWICYVGEIARYLLAEPPSPIDTEHGVKGMFGNGLRPDVWFKFRDRFKVEIIVEIFGSSEGVFGLVNYCRGDYLAKAVGHHGAIARFLNRNTIVPIMVDDVTGEIVLDSRTGFAIRQPYSKGGEIIVKVPNNKVFPGYHGDDEATKKKFAHNVFKDGDIWYRSGDSLRRTSDGRWFFVDRLGDTFRWKGENVSTADVAELIGLYPGIIDANVYGVSLPLHDGKAGCAALYMDPTHRSHFNYSNFLKYCRTHLPNYAVPLFLRVQEEASLTHNFKQNKVPLKREGVDPDRVKTFDEIYWIENNGKGSTYVKFLKNDWDEIYSGKAKL